jgi:ferritin-like protein
MDTEDPKVAELEEFINLCNAAMVSEDEVEASETFEQVKEKTLELGIQTAEELSDFISLTCLEPIPITKDPKDETTPKQ